MWMIYAALIGLSVCSAKLLLATFDGAPGTTFKFTQLNDPVMGGQSIGTWRVNRTGSYAIFEGNVADVPSLGAPGFIKASGNGRFPNASAYINGDVVLTVRTSTPEYKGYRVSFFSGFGMLAPYACAGGGSLPNSRGCFKAKFSVDVANTTTEVRIPLSEFSDLWSPYTGDQTTTCAQNQTACPTAEQLSNITTFEIWAEGVSGKVYLEIVSIAVDTAKEGAHSGTQQTCPQQAAAQRSVCAGRMGCDVIKCNPDGSFASRQCGASGQCWCVDSIGKEVPSTRNAAASATHIDCSKYANSAAMNPVVVNSTVVNTATTTSTATKAKAGKRGKKAKHAKNSGSP